MPVVGIPSPYLLLLAGAAIIGGLGALVRGFGGYRAAARISDTSSSRISSIAVGEVRVSGTVEAAEATLISPLQSAPCVYYRSRILESDRRSSRDVFAEERAVGFRIRDETGSLRIFPRDARWDVPVRFDASTGMFGEQPAGLQYRMGPAIAPGPLEREAQIAALLTVHEPSTLDGLGLAGFGGSLGGDAHRGFVEARLEPGEIVTVIGQVLPFDQLADPAYASLGGTSTDAFGADDLEIALDLAQARAEAVLATDPAAAWGNAAIPGFGIGRPTSTPILDPAADRPVLAPESEASRNRELFEIEPEELVLASSPDIPLVIAYGTPMQAADRQESLFLTGLLGAIVAIAGAIGLALLLGQGVTGL
jgi:hypothetical protein